MRQDEQNARITNDVVFYPIARKIEGYIYYQGNIVPKASVAVTLEAGNKTFFQTTADEKGFVSIDSNNLPQFAYYLVTKPAGSNVVNKITNDVFAQENQSYLEKNKINLMVSNYSNNPNVDSKNNNSKSSGSTENSFNPAGENESHSPNITGKEKSSFNDNQNINNVMIALVMMAIALLTAFIVAFLYIKKKKSSVLDNQAGEKKLD